MSSAGALANSPFNDLDAISADGRFVVFDSDASNLVPGDTNNDVDMFVRDVLAGTTERVSVSSTGTQEVGGHTISFGSISADGRYVVFSSDASGLVPGKASIVGGVFVRDRAAGTTERVDVGSDGAPANSLGSWEDAITADGRFVAFGSWGSNLVPGDTNGRYDVFVRDLVAGTTERVDVSSSGEEMNDGAVADGLGTSARDGRFVAFESYASHLAPGDTNDQEDVFVRDRAAGTTTLVSHASGWRAVVGQEPPSVAQRGWARGRLRSR